MKRVAITRIRLTLGILALSFVLPLLNVHAQGQWVTLPNGRQISANKGAPLYRSYAIKNGKLESLHTEDPWEVVKVIVTLKDEPLAVYKKSNALKKTSLAAHQSSLQAVHSSVKSKISAIAQQLSAKTNFHYQCTVRREYYTAINGMALECNRGMMKYIRSLPEVKNVQLDRQVKADLTQSVHQIRADIVQDSLGYNGDSVLVGEIDTGIDYNNPALGGGFGPGFRVIGGHDFVNNDNDPMDDEGHGTHVAGIIGANGGDGLRGVAPHVKFLAVKALDKDGSGTMSDVIAGIEYCMDPDGNPATNDGVDVINMSLGGQAITDSPVDNAVDNATQAGILSVIAAGNMGDYNPANPFGGSYTTIGSPGTAVSALTVGACDSAFNMATFSSKGPDRIHFAIKPEIVAPGVGILSTILNNGTASWSGTSMATPHVTGVAALLKQQHRDWSPEQLKAAIVNSARPLDNSVYSCVQGNGCVDALNAATLGLSVDPGVINFGIVDLSADVWKDTVEFKVRNLRNTSQNITLEIQSNLPAGVELNLSQTSFTLAPLQETAVTGIITVPSSVPILEYPPYAYTGNIVCRSDLDRAQVPFAVNKINVLTIESDVLAFDLELYSESTWFPITDLYGYDYKYILPMYSGTFNLYAALSAYSGEYVERDTFYILTRKNINTKGYNHISLSHTEAVFSAFNDLDQVRDINGNRVGGLDTSPVHLDLAFGHSPTSVDLGVSFMLFTPKLAQWYIAPLDSSSVTVVEDLFSVRGNQALLLKAMPAGIKAQSDLEFLSGPQNLGDLNLKFDYSSSSSTKAFIETDGGQYSDASSDGWYFSDGYFLPSLGDIHFMTNRNSTGLNPLRYYCMSAGIGTFSGVEAAHGVFELPNWKVCTANFIVDENGDFIFFERKPFRPDLSDYVPIQTLPSGDTVSVQEAVSFPSVQVPEFQFVYQCGRSDLSVSQNSPDAFDDGGVICSNGIHPEILVGANTSAMRQFTAQMFTENSLLQGQDHPIGGGSLYYDYNNVNDYANRYRFLAETAQYYDVLGQRGQVTIDYEFNLRSGATQEYSLPSLDLFQIQADGKVAERIRPGQDVKVRVVIFDPKQNVDSVGIYLQQIDGTEIGLATTHPFAKEYFAPVPGNIAHGFYDVIARVYNTEGDKFELIVSPAFYYGPNEDTIQYDARLLMSSYTLDNPNSVHFNAGDTLRYTLTYLNYGNFTAKDVTLQFPQTDYFIPVGNSTITVDSIALGQYRGKKPTTIPLTLVFLGKKQTSDVRSYYTPTISWNSGGRLFSRKHSILVDFSGTSTNTTEFGNAVPNKYSLSQNYPNPFNPTTTISFALPSRSFLSLKVFDILGREVSTIFSGELQAGSYTRQWDASAFASGVYFYRLQAGPYSETKKLLLLK